MKAFVSSQPGYFSLVWLFWSRKLVNCINRMQKQAQKIVYNDKPLSFKELLDRGSSHFNPYTKFTSFSNRSL